MDELNINTFQEIQRELGKGGGTKSIEEMIKGNNRLTLREVRLNGQHKGTQINQILELL
jgi:hypothetical protein